MLRRTPRAAIAFLGFAAASFGASRAALAGQTTISGNSTLSGTHVYDELVVESGTLSVQPYKAGMPDSGTLTIKANKITVAAGATISATAAGYPGVELMAGNAAPGSNGGGLTSMTAGHPGGGGGYYGKGAHGLDSTCMPFAGDLNTGGAGFFPGMMIYTQGSAGGAANVMSAVTHGAAGGGLIVLQAAEIIIDGVVESKGDLSIAQSGVAPGGGSGGAIDILTWSLTGSGTLSVRGGDGAPANGDMAKGYQKNNGGGGGGGVIRITAPAKGSLNMIFDGGLTGMCPSGAGIDGDPGNLVFVMPMPTDQCVDVDGDSYRSVRCGGTDCDDSNGQVHPGGMEMCDGLDNDCNGTVDDGQICQAGEYCEPLPADNQLHCRVITDGGVEAGVDAGARPDHVEFGGGCGVSPTTGEDTPWWLGGALPALSVLGLALRGRASRRRRRARPSLPPANS